MSHLLEVSLEDNFACPGFQTNVSGSFETLAWLLALSMWT